MFLDFLACTPKSSVCFLQSKLRYIAKGLRENAKLAHCCSEFSDIKIELAEDNVKFFLYKDACYPEIIRYPLELSNDHVCHLGKPYNDLSDKPP